MQQEQYSRQVLVQIGPQIFIEFSQNELLFLNIF